MDGQAEMTSEATLATMLGVKPEEEVIEISCYCDDTNLLVEIQHMLDLTQGFIEVGILVQAPQGNAFTIWHRRVNVHT